MKHSKITIALIIGLSLTAVPSISLGVNQFISNSETDNYIVDEKNTEELTYPYPGFSKMAFLIDEEVPDGIIDIGEAVNWTLVIVVMNLYDFPMENVVVTDILPPQLEVYDIVYHDGEEPAYDKKGKKDSGATHINWTIGDLGRDEFAVLDLTIGTGVNPAGKQQFISSGNYHLNSGAKLKFSVDGKKHNIHTEKIELEVPGEMPDMPSLLILHEKDPEDWSIVEDGAWGKLIFDPVSPTFNFIFYGSKLTDGEDYELIYYPDPWPGDNPGALIGSGSTDEEGKIHVFGSPDLNMDLPHPNDANYPDGAKIWLVLSGDYDISDCKMTGWHPEEYLFENNLITYDDTDVAYLLLYEKDPVTWEIKLDEARGNLKYNLAGPLFEYEFYGYDLLLDTKYSLIYYIDPWEEPNVLIKSGSTDLDGEIYLYGSLNLNRDLPYINDDNHPEGAKIWLIPSSDYNSVTNLFEDWNPGEYLFENNLITYDDTDA